MKDNIQKAREIADSLKFFKYNCEQAQVSMPAVITNLAGKAVCSISLEFPTKPSLDKLEDFRKFIQSFLSSKSLVLSSTVICEIVLPSSILSKYQITVEL